MDISIIIVNYNTQDFLKNCLNSIFLQKDVSFEVWVVDNASSDGSVEMVERDFPQVKLIKNKENLGFARANNLALKEAGGSILFLLNPDTIVKEDTLSKILNFTRKNLEVGMVGIKILNPDGTAQPSVGRFYNLLNTFLMLFGGERVGFLRSSPLKSEEVDWVSGAAMVGRKEILEKAGFFDEIFFMYMEEVEWCYRIRKAGFKIFFYPEAQIIHYERASSSKSEAIWGIYKGLIYFYRRHKPAWQLAILKTLLKTKAILAWGLGILTNNQYLKNTYAKAFRLV